MIMIDVVLDSAELIKSCRVSGHAHAGPKGGDIVCAAVSILTRTALHILSLAEGIVVRGGPLERGLFLMETECTAAGKETLFVAGAFLVEGLHSVSEEYPDYCTMTIRRN